MTLRGQIVRYRRGIAGFIIAWGWYCAIICVVSACTDRAFAFWATLLALGISIWALIFILTIKVPPAPEYLERID